MSAITGLDAVKAKLKRLDQLAQAHLEKAAETGGRAMQADLMSYAPRRTGKLRRLLGSSDALRVRKIRGQIRVEVGFITPAMKKAGFMYFFVETGTKGYEAGWHRSAGYDKRGRKRYSKVKRNIPARPAQPFFRPAVANLRVRMVTLRKEAWAKAAAELGLKG